MHISDSQQQSEEEIPTDGSKSPAAPVSEGSGCTSDILLTKCSLNSEMMTLYDQVDIRKRM